MTIAIGADVARSGDDMTGIAIVEDWRVIGLKERSGRDLMDTTGFIVETIQEHPECILAVDDTGLGGGVTDRLIELGYDLLPVNFCARAYEHDRFRDKATEMWWRMRELLDPRCEEPMRLPWAHPLMSRLAGQLSQAKYKFDSRGRLHLLKKTDGEDSPDLGDALGLAYEVWVTFHMSNATNDRVINNMHIFAHLARN